MNEIASDDQDLILRTSCRAIDEATPVDLPRPHLGMSQIGNPDERTLWLSFRWSLPNDFEPRVRRIFRLGHLLESEVIFLLSRIEGAIVHDRDPQTGKQFTFSFVDGHFGGSMDACMLGVPEAPKTWHVVEIKSVSAKRFNELLKIGVKEWSHEYYAQMQCYMAASGMDRALFVAYCKDDSRIYTERVRPEPMFWPGMLAKAERIITAEEPPASIYKDTADYEAKKVGAVHPVYWGWELPAPNCRNCRFSAPVAAGKWDCDFHRKTISTDEQRAGCPNHNFIPALMPKPALIRETYSDCVEYEIDGVRIWNAEAMAAAVHDDVYSSSELHHMSKSGLSALVKDVAFKDIRTAFDASVVGGPI